MCRRVSSFRRDMGILISFTSPCASTERRSMTLPPTPADCRENKTEGIGSAVSGDGLGTGDTDMKRATHDKRSRVIGGGGALKANTLRGVRRARISARYWLGSTSTIILTRT